MTSPRGIRNHNPLNIRRSKDPWQGLADRQDDGEFFTFQSAPYGIRAAARIIITYQDKHRLKTVREIITRWAPGHENPTDAYVLFVAERVGVKPDDTVDVHRYAVMRPMIEAMIRFENGRQPYDAVVIDKGLALAGIEPPAKPLASTRTGKGVAVGGGATVIGALASEAATQIEPLAGYSEAIKWAFVALTLVGIGITLYARWDDMRKLAR